MVLLFESHLLFSCQSWQWPWQRNWYWVSPLQLPLTHKGIFVPYTPSYLSVQCLALIDVLITIEKLYIKSSTAPTSAFLGSKLKHKEPRREGELIPDSHLPVPDKYWLKIWILTEFFLKLSLKKDFLRMWEVGWVWVRRGNRQIKCPFWI